MAALPIDGDGRDRPGTCIAAVHAQIPSIEATSALSLHPALCSATTRAVPHHQHPVAGAQVLELAADDEDRLALAAHALDHGEQRLLGLHVDARGRVHQHQDRGIVGERPAHHHLLLVAAGEVGDELVRPLGDDAEVADRARGPSRPCGSGAMKPSGPRRSAMVMVVLSATDWDITRPWACRLFGTQPTPSASAAGTSPLGSGVAVDADGAGGVAPEAGHGLGDADPAAAGGAGDADHLAAADGEADAAEVLAGEAVDLERRRPRRRGRSGRRRRRSRSSRCSPVIASISRSFGQVGDRGGDDVAGVAQHRDRLADLVDLLQVVRDEQEGDALAPAARGCATKSRLISSPSSWAVGSSRMMKRAP